MATSVKKISWLLPFEPDAPQDLINCTLASVRLRAATVLDALVGSNLSIEYSSIPSLASHLLVVGKVGADCERSGRDSLWLSAIYAYITSGRPVVIDYTDNHLAMLGAMNRFYARIPRSQYVYWTVPSPWMAENLSKRGFDNISIINDAFEVPIILPRCMPDASIRGLQALWFGHSSNIAYLANFMTNQISPESQSFDLHIVSGGFEPSRLLDHLKKQKCIANIFLHNWSLKNLIDIAKVVDICLLPGDPSDPRKAGVGINRLTTSLALGLPTVASEYSSYTQLGKYFLKIPPSGIITISSDVARSLVPVLSHNQDLLLSEYSYRSIGQHWLKYLNSLLDVSPLKAL